MSAVTAFDRVRKRPMKRHPRGLSLRIEADLVSGPKTAAQVSVSLNHPVRIISVMLYKLLKQGRVACFGYAKQENRNAMVRLWSLVRGAKRA